MGLYKRGETFWFTVTYDGRRIRESLGTDSKKMAEKLYAKVLTDIIEGRHFETANAKRIRFEEMTAKYLEAYGHSRTKRA